MTQQNIIPNIPEFTVTEISKAIKNTVENSFQYIRVRGEISGYKKATSGHLYLNLKDNNALISVVMWRAVANSNVKFELEDGLEVICVGKVTTFAGQSKYQLMAEKIQPAGVGALMALLEKRKKQFAQEGLFDEDKKKKLPFLPKVIGVITSPTGSVIQDIIHRISDRFPLRVLVWPVLVQGETTSNDVTKAINGFNNIDKNSNLPKPDVIIIARGGGSIEDLWGFNEENVVRAVFDSKIPIISAIGHETDFTLLDYVADKRAPTPTGAAEMAVPVKKDIILQTNNLENRLKLSIRKILIDKFERLQLIGKSLLSKDYFIKEKEQKLENLTKRFSLSLPNFLNVKSKSLAMIGSKLTTPEHLIKINQLKLDNLEKNLKNNFSNLTNKQEDRVKLFAKLLESYHYKKVLSRGFAIIRNDDNNEIISLKEKSKNVTNLDIELYDGHIKAKI